MAKVTGQSIPKEKFLTLSANLLHRVFVESARTDAKNLFREIVEGRPVKLTTVRMEDESTVEFGLRLDHSEFPGKLNYGAFRASLKTLLANLSQALGEQRDITVFNPEQNPNNMIFGVTAVTVENGKPGVMVLGADMGEQRAAVTLSLMYLDPGQFAGQQAAGNAGEQEQG